MRFHTHPISNIVYSISCLDSKRNVREDENKKWLDTWTGQGPLFKIVIINPWINDKCDFTNSTRSCRNFFLKMKVNKKMFNADHIIFSGKTCISNNFVHFIAFWTKL
jgi:hypothetical protein